MDGGNAIGWTTAQAAELTRHVRLRAARRRAQAEVRDGLDHGSGFVKGYRTRAALRSRHDRLEEAIVDLGAAVARQGDDVALLQELARGTGRSLWATFSKQPVEPSPTKSTLSSVPSTASAG